jgi:hypothetical protein
MAGAAGDPTEVIYDCIQVGGALKITAVDFDTGIEVSTVGLPALSERS